MAPKVKLTYFDAKGLGETIRYMLANGGIEFEDIRKNYDEWNKYKDDYPFGKLPVLEIDGKTMYQSAAICRYLAKQQGLAGADAVEAQHLDAIVDTIADIRQDIGNYAFYAAESEKPKKKEKLVNETLPSTFSSLEKLALENSGYFSNGKLSYADIIFASQMEFLSTVMEKNLTDGYPTLKSLVEKVHSIPGIKAWVEKRPKTQY